jgi:hypothetical protein
MLDADEKLAIRTESKMHGKIEMTDAMKRAFTRLESLAWGDEEECLFGVVHIFGTPHHVTFVRVDRDPADNMIQAVDDPHNRLEDILAGDYEGEPQTVELPGLPGMWVCGVDPFR